MIEQTPIVSRVKSMWYKPKKVKKLASNLLTFTIQILTNDVQMQMLCLLFNSYCMYAYANLQDFSSELVGIPLPTDWH